ncbi:beta-1,3-galactosyltransferase 5-like [Dermacentor andersoni]|uniref:beta-1,3-galactosyltransferase 5-like n=1 Tax=Dermacentor andersoni TaxID=34620 RepID=UPI002415FEEE|nr:beta-1,3-galactosyltransferase 5-like [Dermacentor andersoni]
MPLCCCASGKKTKCNWVWTFSCTCSLAAVVMTVVIYFRDRRVSGEVYPGYVVESAAFNAPFRLPRSGAYRMATASGKLLIQPPEGACAKAFAGDNGSAPREGYVVVVHSAPHHFEHRSAIRATWARDVSMPLNSGNVRIDALVLFAMGRPGTSPLQHQTQVRIATEAALHQDIIQGSFPGTFSASLPLNAIMLKWVSVACPQASYVVKVSDDSFVNMQLLRETLGAAQLRSSVVYAHIYRKPSVWNGHKLSFIRDNICVPCGYAMSGDTVLDLLNRTTRGGFTSVEHLFWNATQDRVAPLRLVNMQAFSTTRGAGSSPFPCGVRDAIASHHLSAGDMHEAWKVLHNGTASCADKRTESELREP